MPLRLFCFQNKKFFRNIFFPYDPVGVVVSKKLIFELAPLGYFLQKICQGIGFVKSAAQFILHRGEAGGTLSIESCQPLTLSTDERGFMKPFRAKEGSVSGICGCTGIQL